MATRSKRPSQFAPGGAVTFMPNDRYCVLGKTGSGKTQFTTTLATEIIRIVNETAITPWSIFWCDTKGDPKDIRRLRQWGYVRVKSLEGNDPDGPELYRYFKIERPEGEDNCATSVARIAQAAYDRSRDTHNSRPTLLVVDEWAQAVFSARRMGPRLLDVEQRGRGLRCGLMGETQEPVDVPRQLFSQATHQFVFNLSHARDIEWVRKSFKGYVPPIRYGLSHGFWYTWSDGDVGWMLFEHEREFFDWLGDGGSNAQESASRSLQRT